MTFNPNIPQGSQQISATTSGIQTNFSQSNTAFGVDHTPFDTLANQGYHKKATLVQQSVDPGSVALADILYTKSVTYPNAAGTFNELFMRRASGDAGTIVQLTTGPANPSANANGYTFLPGGIILQWGNYTINSPNTSLAVNFPIAFPNTCWSLVITGLSPTAGQTAAYGSLSRTGFTGLKATALASVFYNYIAIGN